MSEFRTIPVDYQVSGYVEVSEDEATMWSNTQRKGGVYGAGDYPAYVYRDGRLVYQFNNREEAEAALAELKGDEDE